MDAALGLKADNDRLFTMAMLLETDSAELVVCIVKICTTNTSYKSHTIKLLKIEPAIKRDSGLHSLKLDDRDGDHLVVHSHNHHEGYSNLFFITKDELENGSNGITSLKFQKKKVILEYQWITTQAGKFLMYIMRDLDVFLITPNGNQAIMNFRSGSLPSISLLTLMRKRVVDNTAIQVFNVNTEVRSLYVHKIDSFSS